MGKGQPLYPVDVFAHPRASGLLAGVALVLVLTAPTRAGAGCGDYVVRGTSTPDVASPDTIAAGPRHIQTGKPTGPTPPVAPCHGPRCSRGLPSPIPPAAPVVLRAEKWGTITVALAAPEHSVPAVHTERTLGPPSDHIEQIFHPPRHAPSDVS
jgi:hypothetical protein